MAIYIVEPNPADRKQIEVILTKEGSYQVHFFENNVGLLDALDGGSRHGVYGLVDTILLPFDPSSGGLEAAKTIKETPGISDIPIVMVSEQSQPESIQIAFAFGASDFVEKPFREIELLARIRSSVRLKHEIESRKARERELLESARQVSDLNRLLVHLSLVDGLTGIANRRCFDVSLDREWRRAQRNKASISIVMMDIDYFKEYNDNYGHRAGDQCLVSVARAIKSTLQRPGDMVARYGGEEFVAILPETEEAGAVKVAEQMRNGILDCNIPHGFSKVGSSVTASFGVCSVVADPALGQEDFVNQADEALYHAKDKGRNVVVSFKPNKIKKSS